MKARYGTATGAETVFGVGLDAQTRCVHWHSAVDIVAIRMACCGRYYACRACHDALAGHAAMVWPQSEFSVCAVLCGACQRQMTIDDYLQSGYRCPRCSAPFNPGCAKHLNLYFAFETGEERYT